MAKQIWLVWGTRGEYSDRYEWPVAAFATEDAAQQAAVALKTAARNLYAVYKSRQDELDNIKDWDGETLFDSTDEGRAWVALHGRDLKPGQYDFDGMDFTCLAVPFHGDANG